MREIKFRAWWRHRDGSAHELDDNILERTISDLNADHLIIEQYTGLKDKNGVEIYEGDIVHLSRTPLHEEGYTTDIYFKYGAFRYRHSDKSGSVCDWRSTKIVNGYEELTQDITVIGNIHENKDLLR